MALRYPSLLQPPVAFFPFPEAAHPEEDRLAIVATALLGGATGVTATVHQTADGELVVHREAAVRVGLRRRPLATLRSSQIPTHVPRLAQLYERCGARFDLAVRLADDEAVERAVGLAGDAGDGAAGRLWLCSSDWRQAASWRTAAGDAKLVDATRLRHVGEGAERRAADLAKAGVDAVRLHESDWNAGLCALFHRFTRLAFAGPVPHQRQLETLLDAGVDGVSSEHADRLAAALDGRSEQDRGTG